MGVVRAVVGVLAVLLVLPACSGDDGGGGPTGPVPPLGGAPVTGPDHEVATGRTGADTGTVDLVSGAATMTVRDADLGSDRVRASTPVGSSVAPSLTVTGGTVTVRLAETGGSGPAAVTVLLDRRVRWQVRMSAGATSQLLDLRGARVSGVDLLGGAARIELRLPAPDGAVPVRMTGGATELAVHLPAGVAAGLRVGAGAGSVTVDGVRRTGLAGGTVVTTATAPDRYDVDAAAGVSVLVLDRG